MRIINDLKLFTILICKLFAIIILFGLWIIISMNCIQPRNISVTFTNIINLYMKNNIFFFGLYIIKIITISSSFDLINIQYWIMNIKPIILFSVGSSTLLIFMSIIIIQLRYNSISN